MFFARRKSYLCFTHRWTHLSVSNLTYQSKLSVHLQTIVKFSSQMYFFFLSPLSINDVVFCCTYTSINICTLDIEVNNELTVCFTNKHIIYLLESLLTLIFES